MTTWGLVVEATVGLGERKRTEAYVLTHVEGSREEALEELERRAREYSPEHPRSPKRRRLLRSSDGFLLVIDGAWQSYATRFSIAELLEDTDRPEPPRQDTAEPPRAHETAPSPAPVPAEPSPVADEGCDEDGVPLRPSWLGRTDLS
ncbi:hypothetical protein [Streptomyces sp. A0592]|uniref:hypothetical protein n=1 Tax=Streptomyces sp. A0592 TaxID=2563099 RepID=UPI00109E61D8|nr:hypothetical protein [Streptomyces sp. A0592]THA81168.1 hypothetical protein E6U81_25325 [Streptomyces sp. A0592]